MQNGLTDSELSTSVEGIVKIVKPDSDFNRRMGNIWFELLKKAALYAAVMGLIAGLAAVLFFSALE